MQAFVSHQQNAIRRAESLDQVLAALSVAVDEILHNGEVCDQSLVLDSPRRELPPNGNKDVSVFEIGSPDHHGGAREAYDRDNARECFRNRCHVQWVEYLLVRVVPNWGPFMSTQQLESHVAVFTNGEVTGAPLSAMLGMYAALVHLSKIKQNENDTDAAFGRKYVLECLGKFVHRENWFVNIMVDLTTRQVSQREILTSQLMSILSSISDMVFVTSEAKEVPSTILFKPHDFQATLSRHICTFLFDRPVLHHEAFDGLTSSTSLIQLSFNSRLKVVNGLLPRLCRLGLAKHLGHALLQFLLHTKDMENHKLFWSSLSDSCLEPLLYSVLCGLQNVNCVYNNSESVVVPHQVRCTVLNTILASLIHPESTHGKHSEKLRYLIYDRFLSVKRLPPSVLWALLDVIALIPQHLPANKLEDQQQLESESDEFTTLPSPTKESTTTANQCNISSLVQVTKRTAAMWSDHSFATETDFDQHAYITGVLRGCLRRLSAKDVETSSILIPLVQGVQTHLQSNVPHSQTLGMLVGEEFSCTLNIDNKLDFEQLKDSSIHDNYSKESEQLELREYVVHEASRVPTENDTLLSGIVEEDPNLASIPSEPGAAIQSSSDLEENSPGSNKDGITKKYKTIEKFDDTHSKSVWYSSSSDQDSDDESESEEEILVPATSQPPQDMRRKRPDHAPRYLRECMQALDTDKFHVFRDTLSHMPSLICSSVSLLGPDETAAVAPPLVHKLLFLENKFGLPNFVATRMDILTKLVVASPKNCIMFLSSQMYSRSLSLGSYLDIMQIVVSAAQELSAVSPTSVTTLVSSMFENEVSAESAAVAGETSKTTLGTVVRRWGQRRNPPMVSKRNEFAPYAAQFFGVLLSHAHDSDSGKSRTSQLFELQPMLLGRVVLSLGALLECSQNLPNVEHLALSSLELVWWARLSQNPDVRRAAIYFLAQFLVVVPNSILVSRLESQVDETVSWLVDTAQRDSDMVCRAHAGAVLSSEALQNVIRNL